MEEKQLIYVNRHAYIVKNEKLIDAQTQKEEKKLPYKYIRNYMNDDICYIIIQNRFFRWNKKRQSAEELGVEILCQNPRFTYYYTLGNINFVFATAEDGKSFVLGKSFQPIYDNLYKIGRYAYQIINGELEKLCECMEFEKIGVRIEISAGENGVSEMLAFQKVGNVWQVVNHWRPGNIAPQYRLKSNFKK